MTSISRTISGISTITPTSNRRTCVIMSAKKTFPTSSRKRDMSLSFLLSGFAAAQLSLMPVAGPAMADVTTNAPMPSIDWVSEQNVEDVLVEVEEAEIPQLEVRLGDIASKEGDQYGEALAAAQSELQAIETEAAQIAEQAERDGPSELVANETGGLLSNITALKNTMRGIISRGD